MNRVLGIGLMLLLLTAMAPQHTVAGELARGETRAKLILGWVERVGIAGVSVKAKLDTGAKTSSLDARNIEAFERDGERWVRFELETRNKEHPQIVLEKPVERVVRIKEHDGKSQRRYVVRLQFCTAKRTLDSEFSLVDRGRFLYPVLLGRTALQGRVVVDPEETFLGGIDCVERRND